MRKQLVAAMFESPSDLTLHRASCHHRNIQFLFLGKISWEMGSGVVYHGGKDLTEIQTQVIDLQTLSMFRNVGFKFDACLKRSKIYVSAGVSSTPFEHAPSYGRERGSNPPLAHL
jgi:hypothetical protein